MTSLTVENNTCIITLDNPPHNYLVKPEFTSAEKLDRIISYNNCKALIIHGNGRHFSAGANRDNLFKMANDESLKTEIEKGKKLLQQLKTYRIPIIACIEGSCLGGGLEIALNADIRIASKKALFAFPEVNLNVIPGLGGIHTTVNKLNKAKALELILKGDIIDAETALSLNLVDELSEAKNSLARGLELSQSMTNGRSLDIIQAVVECIRNADELPYETALDRETELFCNLAKKAADKLNFDDN